MSTFTQIYIQTIFAVKGRESLIASNWEERFHKYISGIVHNKGQKLLAINGMSDHIHILMGLKPACNLSDLVREIKKSSNVFIRHEKLTPFKFDWQEGFGAFSYGHSQLDQVIAYIMNQKEHHRKISFKNEFIEFLERFNINHKKEYLFEWIEL